MVSGKAIEGDPNHGCHARLYRPGLSAGTAHLVPPGGGRKAGPVRYVGLRLDLIPPNRRQLEMPARTLHYWVRRKRTWIENSSRPKPVARFLESPEGLDFLHRLLTAAEVGRRLASHFDTLEQVAAEVGLSVPARDKLAKAHRVLLTCCRRMTYRCRDISEKCNANQTRCTSRLFDIPRSVDGSAVDL